MQMGDFSGLTNSSGVLQVLYDPATTTNNPACAGGSNVACRQTFTQEYNEGPGSGPSNCNGHTNCIPANEEAALTKTLNAMTPSTTGPNGVLNPQPARWLQPTFKGQIQVLLSSRRSPGALTRYSTKTTGRMCAIRRT